MKFESRQFTITAPKEAWDLLDEYGYDYEKNFTEQLRSVYFEMIRCLKEQKKEAK